MFCIQPPTFQVPSLHRYSAVLRLNHRRRLHLMNHPKCRRRFQLINRPPSLASLRPRPRPPLRVVLQQPSSTWAQMTNAAWVGVTRLIIVCTEFTVLTVMEILRNGSVAVSHCLPTQESVRQLSRIWKTFPRREVMPAPMQQRQ